MTFTNTLTVRSGLDDLELQAVVAHEGSHLLDVQAFAASFSDNLSRWEDALNVTGRETEIAAYSLTAEVAAIANATFKMDGGKFRPNMPAAEVERETEKILKSGLYPKDYLDNPFIDWPSMSPPPSP
jgi:hypothetical protein